MNLLLKSCKKFTFKNVNTFNTNYSCNIIINK